MNLKQVDVIEHWLTKIKDTDNGSRYAARKYAGDCRKAGYSPETAVDLLVSKNFSVEASEGAVEDVYGLNAKPTTRTASKKNTQPLIPASYEDVAPAVEKALQTLGSNEFITRLCKAENPIVKMSSKSMHKLANLAENALYDPNALQELHLRLTPWFEEAMLNSVLLAEKMNAKVLKSKTEADKYKVVTSKSEAVVNLRTATSTGKRFSEGNFADFGLADEYLVAVAEEVSPEVQLKRALEI